MLTVNFWQNGHRGTRLAIITPDSICIVAIEVGLCRSVRIGGIRGSLTSGYAKLRESRLATIWARGKKPSLCDQKRIGGNTHRCVVMKAAPATDLVTSQSYVLELSVIFLNRPASLGCINKPRQGRFLGQRQEPVTGRLALLHGPFHQQPFLCARSLSLVLKISWSHALGGEMRAHLSARSFTPGNRAKRVAPKLLGQLSDCQLLYAESRWLASTPAPRVRVA